MTRLLAFRWMFALMAATLWTVMYAAFALGQPAGTPRVHQRTPAPSEPTLVLEPVIAPPVGTEGTFIITERLYQGLSDRTGFFMLVPEDEFGDVHEDVTLAVRARYTMLPPDPETGAPRVLVEALPVDAVTGLALQEGSWQTTWVLVDGEAKRQDGSAIPDEYGDLVRPDWLVEWSLSPGDQLPQRPLVPGDTWRAVPDLDLDDFPFGELKEDVPLTGRFVGWVDVPGAPDPAAHLMETMRSVSTVRQELAEGIPADVTFTVDMSTRFWLLRDDFPHEGKQQIDGAMLMEVNEQSGAPAGIEGTMELVFVIERSIRRDGEGGPLPEPVGHGSLDDWVVWPGEPVRGVLGPGSERFDDGTYVDYYLFHGTEGERVTVRLQSDDFDAYLILLSDDDEVLAQDDDSGGGGDALLRHTLPYTGAYWVAVNTLFAGETGAYTLTVESDEGAGPDVDRALELISRLRHPHLMSDKELRETEDVLYQLLELTSHYRRERIRNSR